MRRTLLAALLMVLGLLAWGGPAARAGQTEEFQRIITEQIGAFNADDASRAFSFASPLLQRYFATPENFMAMVKQGYQPVYRQHSYKFADTFTDTAGRLAQKVLIVDLNGKVWTAIYTFEKQPDGSWRISSCSLVETEGAAA